MDLSGDEPPHSFTVKCLGCGKSLTVSGESEDELRERLAASGWQMVAAEAMADPINDGVDFLCAACPVNYF